MAATIFFLRRASILRRIAASLEHYQEQADDLRTAEERHADPQPGIPSDQLRKNLGLDS